MSKILDKIELLYALNYPFYIGVVLISAGITMLLLFILSDFFLMIRGNIKNLKDNRYTNTDKVLDELNFKKAFIRPEYILKNLEQIASQFVYAIYSGDDRYISDEYLLSSCSQGILENFRRDQNLQITKILREFSVLESRMLSQEAVDFNSVKDVTINVAFHVTYDYTHAGVLHNGENKDFIQSFKFQYIGNVWKLIEIQEEKPYRRKKPTESVSKNPFSL